MLKYAEVVETDVGGQLEFKYCAGFPEIFDQLLSSAGAEIGCVETVTDSHGRHGLPGSE